MYLHQQEEWLQKPDLQGKRMQLLKHAELPERRTCLWLMVYAKEEIAHDQEIKW